MTQKKVSRTSTFAQQVTDALARTYPNAVCALNHKNPFELLAATILSAQCTDKRVNLVTPNLFAAYPDAYALAQAQSDDVENLVRTCGFYKNKSKNLIGMAQRLVTVHGGVMPRTIKELILLPGVARKTANVLLGVAFGEAEGIVVDTHVARVSKRLGLTKSDSPEKIEQELMKSVAQSEWIALSHRLIEHGRQVCDARRPKCGACPLQDVCKGRDKVLRLFYAEKKQKPTTKIARA